MPARAHQVSAIGSPTWTFSQTDLGSQLLRIRPSAAEGFTSPAVPGGTPTRRPGPWSAATGSFISVFRPTKSRYARPVPCGHLALSTSVSQAHGVVVLQVRGAGLRLGASRKPHWLLKQEDAGENEIPADGRAAGGCPRCRRV